jgi:hypothetical protein
MIEQALASGLFPSRQAVLEAGVQRLMQDQPLTAPPEHLAAIERSLDQLDAGFTVEWNVEEEIRRYHERRAERRQAMNP